MTITPDQVTADVTVHEPTTDEERIASIGQYNYGWHDSDSAGATAQRGLSEAVVRDISTKKSESEILNMRKAGQVSGRAFTETMKTPIDTEKDLWTMLDTGFKIGGLDGSAYVPVVAGGKV